MTLFISLYQIITTRQNIFHTYGMDNYLTRVTLILNGTLTICVPFFLLTFHQDRHDISNSTIDGARGGAVWIRSAWRCLQRQRRGSIGDPGGFGNGALGEGDTDRIDIDGGGADRIGDEEEVVGSGDIGAEKTGDPGGSDDDALPNGGADRIKVVDEGGTHQNDVDDADVDLYDDENSRSAAGWGNHIARAQTRLAASQMGRAGETLAQVRCVWGCYIVAPCQMGSGPTGWFHLVQPGSEYAIVIHTAVDSALQ
jgi:hypothetical protein